MDLLRELASYAWLPNGLAALLGLPSALLYLVEVLIVWRCRHLSPFNSSFFSLFVVRALPSIFNLLCSYWGIRFGLLGLFYPLYLRMPVWLLNFFFFISYYTYQVENLSSTFLLLNRFSSIAFPLSYDAFWHRWMPAVCLLIFGLPLAFTMPTLGVHMQVSYFDKTNTSFGIIDLETEFPNSQLMSHSGAFFLAICVLLNIASWVVYRRKYAQILPQSDDPILASGLSRIEWHLFLYASLTFLCQLAMTIHYYGIYFATLHAYDYDSFVAQLWMEIVFNFYGLGNDICTVIVPAWLVLFTCAKMQKILKMQLQQLCQPFDKLLSRMKFKKKKKATIGGCTRLDGGRQRCENNFIT